MTCVDKCTAQSFPLDRRQAAAAAAIWHRLPAAAAPSPGGAAAARAEPPTCGSCPFQPPALPAAARPLPACRLTLQSTGVHPSLECSAGGAGLSLQCTESLCRLRTTLQCSGTCCCCEAAEVPPAAGVAVLLALPCSGSSPSPGTPACRSCDTGPSSPAAAAIPLG